jgi:PIN domain nuclease of toxin-antitoxin system
MRYLLDTQLLLWAGAEPERLSPAARTLIGSDRNTLFFSAASLWEIAIKASLNRQDFEIDPDEFHSQLLANSYLELPVTAAQAITLKSLKPRHKDPFDRMLLAQAMHEKLTLVTADRLLGGYEGPVVRV